MSSLTTKLVTVKLFDTDYSNTTGLFNIKVLSMLATIAVDSPV